MAMPVILRGSFERRYLVFSAAAFSIMEALPRTKDISYEMSRWLNYRIRSTVPGYSDVRISDLAKGTFGLALNK